MIKVLFVCHGNICRSAMAEVVMKDLAAKAGVAMEVASAAVSAEELGNPMYPPARRELERHGLDGTGHRARQICRKDLAHYDCIYYMDSSNARWLRRLFPGADLSHCKPLLERDAADPWYTGDFGRTWADICLGCEKILEEFK